MPSFEEFRTRYASRWEKAHGPIEGLVRLELQEPGSAAEREPDVTSYSFDRAIVTDSPAVAAMLVANHFHFENNCAILSENYPPGMKDTLLMMLRRNPNLAVFAVHSASAGGCELPIELRKAQWFPDAMVNVYDTGLRPRQALALKLPRLNGARRALSNELRALLKPDEVTLLENGDAFDLEALRPSKVMRTLYKYLNRARKPETSSQAGIGLEYAPIFFIGFEGDADGGDANGDADGDAGGGDADSFG